MNMFTIIELTTGRFAMEELTKCEIGIRKMAELGGMIYKENTIKWNKSILVNLTSSHASHH